MDDAQPPATIPTTTNNAPAAAPPAASTPAALSAASTPARYQPSLLPPRHPPSAGAWAETGGVNPAFKDKIKADVIGQIKGCWLEGFERPGPPPRKLPLHKFYMQHEDYAEAVEARFNAEWPRAGLEPKFSLSFRCNCAKELLEEEDEATHAKLVAEWEEEHEAAVAEYNGRPEKVGEPDEPDAAKREACRMNLAQVVQPFLDGIAKLTGLHVTLLAGRRPAPGQREVYNDSVSCIPGRTLDIGNSPGYKFHEWDPDGFKKNIMLHWMKFLGETASRYARHWRREMGSSAECIGSACTSADREYDGGNRASRHPGICKRDSRAGRKNVEERDARRGRKRREKSPDETPSSDGIKDVIAGGDAQPEPRTARHNPYCHPSSTKHDARTPIGPCVGN
ncbi:hypothetical protein B0H14DRAFT_3489729 [Mycena olivaceomarginata]|nr:hypothetical protein B0H14DRAFT_3489729 [Mycena olivaceomarginata]